MVERNSGASESVSDDKGIMELFNEFEDALRHGDLNAVDLGVRAFKKDPQICMGLLVSRHRKQLAEQREEYQNEDMKTQSPISAEFTARDFDFRVRFRQYFDASHRGEARAIAMGLRLLEENPRLFVSLGSERISQDAISPRRAQHEVEAHPASARTRQIIINTFMLLAGAGVTALIVERGEKPERETKGPRSSAVARDHMTAEEKLLASQQERVAAIDVLLRDERLLRKTQASLYAEKAGIEQAFFDTPGALDSMTNAIEHDPEEFDFRRKRAELYSERAKKEHDTVERQITLEAAVWDFTTAMELFAKQDRATDPTFLLERRAKAYEELGYLEKAIRDLSEAQGYLFNEKFDGVYTDDWQRERYEGNRKVIEELRRRLREQR